MRRERSARCRDSASSTASGEARFCSTSISPIGLPMFVVCVASAGTNQRITAPARSGG